MMHGNPSMAVSTWLLPVLVPMAATNVNTDANPILPSNRHRLKSPKSLTRLPVMNENISQVSKPSNNKVRILYSSLAMNTSTGLAI